MSVSSKSLCRLFGGVLDFQAASLSKTSPSFEDSADENRRALFVAEPFSQLVQRLFLFVAQNLKLRSLPGTKEQQLYNGFSNKNITYELNGRQLGLAMNRKTHQCLVIELQIFIAFASSRGIWDLIGRQCHSSSRVSVLVTLVWVFGSSICVCASKGPPLGSTHL